MQKPTQQQLPNEAAAVAATAVPKTSIPAHITSESGDEPKTPDKRGPVDNVAKLDLLERGQTPERIEFENTDAMSDGEPSEEHIIDEHEWSGRNFLPESNNDSESDISSSDESDTESDSDIFEEANDSPLGVQTLQLASEWIGKQNYSDSDDSDDFYDSSEGMAGMKLTTCLKVCYNLYIKRKLSIIFKMMEKMIQKVKNLPRLENCGEKKFVCHLYHLIYLQILKQR